MKRCIFLLFDGARPDVLEKLAQNGDMPHVRKRFFESGTAASAVTVFPSTTGPAYLPFITGAFPGPCNIPGIRWLDRQRFAKNPFSHASRRSYVGYENSFFNRDLSPHVPTIYEKILPCFSINSIVTRGLTGASPIQALPQSLLMFYAKLSHHWKPVDDFGARHFFKALRQAYRFFFVSFLSIDEESHLTHPFSDRTYQAYKRLDTVVGKLFDELETSGTLDETLVMISSDHGLTATTQHFELWRWFERRGRRVFYYPNVFKTQVDAACMVSGNAMAHMYLKPKEGWAERTYDAELKASGLLEGLMAEPAVDVVATRDEGGSVFVYRGSKKAVLSAHEGGSISYQPLGDDPFGYPALPNVMTEQQALELTFASDYPDALVQLAQIFQSPRTGDMVVTSKLGHDLRNLFEIPPHHGSHGSLHREHMRVPLLASSKGAFPSGVHRTLSVHRAALEHLQD